MSLITRFAQDGWWVTAAGGLTGGYMIATGRPVWIALGCVVGSLCVWVVWKDRRRTRS